MILHDIEFINKILKPAERRNRYCSNAYIGTDQALFYRGIFVNPAFTEEYVKEVFEIEDTPIPFDSMVLKWKVFDSIWSWNTLKDFTEMNKKPCVWIDDTYFITHDLYKKVKSFLTSKVYLSTVELKWVAYLLVIEQDTSLVLAVVKMTKAPTQLSFIAPVSSSDELDEWDQD